VETELPTEDLAAVFFLSREKPAAGHSLEQLLRTAGVQGLRLEPRVPGLFIGTWADMPCEGSLAELNDSSVLWIRFGRSSFFDQIYPRPEDDHLESEPGLLLVQAFRDACDALEADVGMLLTQPWQASDEWIAEQAWAVSGLFSIHLRYQGIGLLYLNTERVQAQSAHAVLDENDQLPAQHGRLYFVGLGRQRWS
jgi:hypothetical protein